MAFAYQGPLFDPSWTERRVAQFIRGILKRLPLGLRVAPAATAISDRLVSRVLFRGFKRCSNRTILPSPALPVTIDR